MRSKPRVTDADITLGRRVRALRKRARLSLDDMAVPLGVTKQQVQKYEIGVNRFAASRLPALAALLGVPLVAFFEDVK